jgi:hypothetical protein
MARRLHAKAARGLVSAWVKGAVHFVHLDQPDAVNQQRDAGTCDQAGVTPSPSAVRLHPCMTAKAQVAQAL